MKSIIKSSANLLLTLLPALCFCLQASAQVTISDERHYSTVFGETRNFRAFLPKGYFDQPRKKYPVIYFMHGWSQRYFGSGEDNYAAYDLGMDNNGDNIEKFVAEHDVIVIKSDGYNRSPKEDYYKRPYNVGPVETYRQFPIYFEELISYIDSYYNTINDRSHRAITGLSMGGFMAYLIGGKYPHLFSAVGSFCPSAEFFIGPIDFPVEYNHTFMYKNYEGSNTFLHYGDKDFIRSYHEDRNKIWSQVMDHYTYKIYPGEHSTTGLGDMFSSLFNSFKNPPPTPAKWNHADLYPNFSVWGYTIQSDRNIPGFTILENADARGFRSVVREFLPNGRVLAIIKLSITTPPIYKKNSPYFINDLDLVTGKTTTREIRSDSIGRLQISLNGSIHEVGINEVADQPNICLHSPKPENIQWVTPNKDVAISIELSNKGRSTGKNIKAILSTENKATTISNSKTEIGDITVNGQKKARSPFVFQVHSDSIEIVKFKLTIQDDSKNEWSEFFEISLQKEYPLFKDIEIADGKIFTVAKAGNGEETLQLGTGNGDGVANPGESILLLVKDQGKYWRTVLYQNDTHVNPFGTNIRKSDSWENFDYVGGSAKYNVPLIAADCPDATSIDFYASYWVPAPERSHLVKQGKISILVKGKDNTAPLLQTAFIAGDNILNALLLDGAAISSVKATFISIKTPDKTFTIELKDNGNGGDRVAGDRYFSCKFPTQGFGSYRIIISATDSFGNASSTEAPGTFVLH